MGNSIKKFFKTVSQRARNEKELEKQLKAIENQARELLKKHKTLDLFYEYSYTAHTPLEAAINSASVEVFQLLIRLGASPFFKPKADMPSALELLANDYFSVFSIKEKTLFEWLMQNKESPVFTWEKLSENKKLFEEFRKTNLIPKKRYLNELPIHVAIKSGRIELVRDVLIAAGGIQQAGDISRISVLTPAIQAVLDGKENSLVILKYLLSQGANPQIPDTYNLPAIMQAVSAQVLYCPNAKEEAVLEIVKALLEYGATLNVTNPNNGHVPLMSAMGMGYKTLFYFLLDKADATTLNHRASLSPYYLIFQLFDDNKLRQVDILKLLFDLKEKGLEFNKTIDRDLYADPFSSVSYSSKREVSVKGMTVLHFYIDQMTRLMDDPFQSIDKYFEIIQALIAHGADPQAKATFILTEEVRDESAYSKTKEVQTNLELTASEYARKIAHKIISRYDSDMDGHLIKTYQDENEFLQHISYYSKEEQTRRHKKFHNFRNLERVLSGEKPLPYAGLPDVDKMKKPKPVTDRHYAMMPLLDMQLDDDSTKTLEQKLIEAKKEQNQAYWKVIKLSIVDYVKEAESLHDFLTRVEQFKQPLQLHYNITTNKNGEVISYGSTMYRFFHFFDPYKFPNSWETLRTFGKDTYGVDINTQYQQSPACQI
ncbi:ankyrin repeat domain-containing protein [Fluoribacter gormanii]|uniref:ankyrin repeat domain-containing protein n=1 Tax=Fluoribacter gormanii TaxID=464 RepID=UPI001041A41D|nr:ankyrin repeat domain-containing protein [Fluoribacter gormanii]